MLVGKGRFEGRVIRGDFWTISNLFRENVCVTMMRISGCDMLERVELEDIENLRVFENLED